MVRPRRLVHRGVVDAAGVLVSSAGARRDVLALVGKGTRVFRTAHGFAILGDRRVDTRASAGAALVRAGGALSTCPLDDDELAALSPPPGTIVVVRGGAAEIARLDAAEDVSTWLDPGLALVDVASLGAPPVPPIAAVSPPTTVRAAFRDVAPAPAPEAAALAEALRSAGVERARGAKSSPDERAAPAIGAAALGALVALARMMALLAAALGSARPAAQPGKAGKPTAGGDGAASKALAALPAPPSGPSLAERLRARLADLIARALLATNLAQLVGRRQAKYLRDMVDLFERGDLDAALKRAIPLGDGEGPSHPALTVPTPRDAIQIAPSVSRGGSSLMVRDVVMDDLRAIYRRAFEQLDRRGEIDKAAFVLAELLRANDEAVAYLERHERYRLAAEIAEARSLAPGLVVRLWFLAKDWRRAAAIARRESAFADAIVRLERSHPSEAEALRLVWADVLASAGDYAGAIVAAGPGAAARGLVAAFIERAIDAGGPVAARLLARRATLAPDQLTDTITRASEIFAAEGSDRADERAALARGLVDEAAGPVIALLSRPAVRATMRDRGDGRSIVPDAVLHELIARAGDELRADAPTLGSTRTPPKVIPVITLDRNDVGATPTWDSAPLARGRTLVALGEAGVVILGRDGRVLHLFDEPAHALVLSDAGDRALALARRGDDLHRLARLDLVGRRSEPWTEARLVAWARTFDGGTWLVALPTRGGELATIDCLVPRFETLSRLAGLGTPKTLVRTAGDRALAFVGVDSVESLDLAIPALRLARRAAADAHPRGALFGEGAFTTVDASNEHAIAWAERPSGEAHYVRAVEEGSGLVAQLDFIGATRLSARLTATTMTACDDRGRVVVVDLTARLVLRSLRV
jgi:hypothetical protein